MLELYIGFEHPLSAEIFTVFDCDNDGVVWFSDLVNGFNIIERGTFT